MSDPGDWGGYVCERCGARRVTACLMDQHVRRERPEESEQG